MPKTFANKQNPRSPRLDPRRRAAEDGPPVQPEMNKQTATSSTAATDRPRGWFRSLGPALIVATVVVGPGSILTSSSVGTDFGYSMIWLLAVSTLLMLGMTALSARLGTVVKGSLCDEIRQRLHPAVAILTGVCVFLITTCFQFANNLGILAAMEPVAGIGNAGKIATLVAVNGVIIGALVGFRRLYVPLERVMLILAGIMLIGFAGNLLFSQPSLIAIIGGFVPSLPDGALDNLLPYREGGVMVDAFLPVQALIGTTFSVAGAFYVGYLARKKGWTADNWKEGFSDSAVGIFMLGLISLMIMVTAASVFHGNISSQDLGSVSDVAIQLEPLFGTAAVLLFSLGIFAGAFSSFLVNALIGGTLLADGLGLGSDMDSRWPKIFTVLSLAVGMLVAVGIQFTGQRPVNLIIFAQALTVLGNPVLAGLLVWLSFQIKHNGRPAAPAWLRGAAIAGLLLVLFLAFRTGVRLYLQNFT